VVVPEARFGAPCDFFGKVNRRSEKWPEIHDNFRAIKSVTPTQPEFLLTPLRRDQ
jgi:hypothetical protein